MVSQQEAKGKVMGIGYMWYYRQLFRAEVVGNRGEIPLSGGVRSIGNCTDTGMGRQSHRYTPRVSEQPPVSVPAADMHPWEWVWKWIRVYLWVLP